MAGFTARAAEKIRMEGLGSYCIQVMIATSPHDLNGYYVYKTAIRFLEPTAYTPYLITSAKNALKGIFKEGLAYKKAGIELLELTPLESFQRDLFADRKIQEKQEKLIQAVDLVNLRYGNCSLTFAAEGRYQKQKNGKSLSYSLSWDELLTIQI